MAILDKKTALFSRDENGELIPQRIKIDKEGTEIVATPMLRGETKRLFMEAMLKDGLDAKIESTLEQDKKIIMKHCKNPEFTEEELEHMKPSVINKITNAIISISGLEDGKTGEEAEEAIRKN